MTDNEYAAKRAAYCDRTEAATAQIKESTARMRRHNRQSIWLLAGAVVFLAASVAIQVFGGV